MKAVVQKVFGGPETLQIEELPIPEVRPHDLLVRVGAAGVNRADALQRMGRYGRANFGDSELMGLEVAGEVVELGASVSGYQIGDRVMGIVGGGAYAEFARMDHRMAMPIPRGMDDVRAAAIPEVFVTAHEALFHLGRLEADQSVLVHAAAGGVGSAAVQLAHRAGARIFASTSAEKLQRVLAWGADRVIDYRAESFQQVIDADTDGQGVNLVVDFIGAPYLAANIHSLAEGGRMIQVGILGGGSGGELPLDRFLYRRLSIMGTVMKSRSLEEKCAMVERFSERWLALFDDGRLHPVVDSVYALEDAQAAHRRLESGQAVGKIILSTAALGNDRLAQE
ncbi:NAD(P)H-quinone oxidoreductase [Comamonas sp. MYb396]|uniref:NAD(P)H-quinone oxidoreductase n=1 Tax=Comamonas sp. MYb396 TaxID=2745302 RepID=UPI0030B1C760